MAKVGLISCVSLKQKKESEASDLYISPLFKKSKEYATERLDKFFILSAKHGLLKPADKIFPYDMSLNKMSKKERIEWTEDVFSRFKEVVTLDDEIVFLAGENYREFLEKKIVENGNKTTCPLFKMSIGEQLRWYTSYAKHKDRIKDLDVFYTLIKKLSDGLNGGFKLKDSDGKHSWPERGVYFFTEDTEYRKTSPFEKRIIRVGTHAVSKGSKSTLWNRLRTHRGGTDLKGNHRGSIFRLHIGNSIICEENLVCPTWGIGQNASSEIKISEEILEKMVSEVIGNMNILWISINDIPGKESDRSFIEKNSIGLLSTFIRKIDTASKNWLGNYNPNIYVKESSLWNVDYIKNDYDPRFLEILDTYITRTINGDYNQYDSIVPKDWIINKRYKEKQLDMFD